MNMDRWDSLGYSYFLPYGRPITTFSYRAEIYITADVDGGMAIRILHVRETVGNYGAYCTDRRTKSIYRQYKENLVNESIGLLFIDFSTLLERSTKTITL